MELRTYAQILWRRLWIILLLVGVVTLYAGYQYYTTHKSIADFKTYRSNITLRIGLQANTQSTDQNYADYIATNETLADEFATGPVINSKEFGDQVVQQMQKDMDVIKLHYGETPDLGDWQHGQAVANALSNTRSHGLVTVTISWSSEAGAWAIAHAVGEVSVEHISTYLDYEVRDLSSSVPTGSGHPLAAAKVVSESSQPVATIGTQSKTTMLLLLIVVALIVGIALAFLVEYLDDRIHNPEEVAQLLQLPLYGKIPRTPTPGQTRIHHDSKL